MSIETNTIRKEVFLKTSRERVWKAISDSQQFGEWFGVRFNGPFVAGRSMRGFITPTVIDSEVAKKQAAYEGKPFEITVERVDAESVFSFRWHPFAIEPGKDYSGEPTTLVEFVLEDAEGGTTLTITESGFDQIPIERRAKAFEMNDHGWEAQTTLIRKYLESGE